MNEFLAATDVIDWRHPGIRQLARSLAEDSADVISTATRIFEWVRDEIEHTVDFGRQEVTCRASEVLSTGTGFCYAKSHLVAALMRSCRIPAGLCYQRLSIDGNGPPYCLHGMNAVLLEGHGWYRFDARGDTGSIRTGFTPPREQLAFEPGNAGEATLPDVYPAPLECVVTALHQFESASELAANLPDLP